MRNLFCFILIAFSFFGCNAQSVTVKDGDIIFIQNPMGQGKAIQLATASKYTHVGVIFYENGKPMVYHAVQPVSVNTLEEFKKMSSDGKFEIKRLKDQTVLTKDVVAKMLQEAKSLLGVSYDIYFAWDDKEMYCSEYVWKIYQKYLHLEIGKLRPLKEFNLNASEVKEIMKKRYGNNIPYNEKMISPGDMYESVLLN